MFGIMGIGSAFVNAAGRGGKKQGQIITIGLRVSDYTLSNVSCNGEIIVETIKNGEKVSTTYQDLSSSSIALQNDVNTSVVIKGAVTKLDLGSGANIPQVISAESAEFLEVFSISTSDGTLETANFSGTKALEWVTIRQDMSADAANGLAAAITASLITTEGKLTGYDGKANIETVKAAASAKGWTYVNSD